jgi:hypothetical protein
LLLRRRLHLRSMRLCLLHAIACSANAPLP